LYATVNLELLAAALEGAMQAPPPHRLRAKLHAPKNPLDASRPGAAISRNRCQIRIAAPDVHAKPCRPPRRATL
ncbi:MAG TPA: hypothetical protein VL154_03555, partial [Acetobacteraceae bacterium]|nr:hypothetical protein [Acetobacteraceae bacterium]